MREAIKKLKFKFIKDMEEELKLLINSGLERKLVQPNTRLFRKFLKLKPRVQPLPLFWYRHNWRGFNQAEVIGKIVAKKLKLKQTHCFERVKLTEPQSQLDRDERLANVTGIFRVKPQRLPRAVLLVDDVWTTGSTMHEAMKVLKTRGVKQIWGLTLAT
jgi:ComF family protein